VIFIKFEEIVVELYQIFSHHSHQTVGVEYLLGLLRDRVERATPDPRRLEKRIIQFHPGWFTISESNWSRNAHVEVTSCIFNMV